jgi:NTP pyrophosphatase (non-canonical NTP hydrolase)
MKDRFDEFYEILKIDRQNSDFSRKRDLFDLHDHLVGEVEELKQALDNDDGHNVMEELGDVFWNTLMIMIMAEEKYGFTGKDVIEDSLAKIRRRKDHIFDENNGLSREEELDKWKKIKVREKNGEFDE